MFDIEEELKKLPDSPGVYLHKNNLGEVIYVGKAVNLKRRVSSYFRKSSQHTPKVKAMVSNISEFEYINCATEMEALILECNLIKKYMPKYNILLKDDKTYPYIEVTMEEEFPRVIKTRIVRRDENLYFGPYSNGTAVWQMLKMIDEMYPIKTCRQTKFPENVRPCLNYFIGKCKGVCIGAVSRDEYMEMINDITRILEGHDSKLVKELTEKMQKASDELRYEDAAKYRDYIKAIKELGETQRATIVGDRDIDVLIPVITKKNKIVIQYTIRDGKMIGRDVHYMENTEDEDLSHICSEFVKQYYTGRMKLPREILLQKHIEDEEMLESLLDSVNQANADAGKDVLHKTKFIVPQRGSKKSILDMTLTDSVDLTSSLDARAEREIERDRSLREKITKVIERACALNGSVPRTLEDDADREYRIEAYDISNMNGLDSVGAMVVYEGRKPVRRDYRKFRIRTAGGGDDYGSLQEVLYRRLKRAKNGDPGFSTYPDIMFIDGGLGQVHAVKTVMDAFGLSIPVVGLAKDDAHRTRAIVFEDGSEIDLKKDSILFSYAGTIQEEVHRFAITYQRGTRGKRMTKSVLEEIDGVGPKRRKMLLEHFRGMDGVKKASYEDLMKVDGMTSNVAENIYEFFH